jgi:general L-amino acid transport system permease protein
LVALAAVGTLGYYLFTNTLANLERQSIATGFGFLEKEASFEIGEALVPYSAADTYARALLVGVLNTLKVSFIGIVLTIVLGTFVGIARLSSNWLVAKLSALYIEFMQDIPRIYAGHSGAAPAVLMVCHILRDVPISPAGPEPF